MQRFSLLLLLSELSVHAQEASQFDLREMDGPSDWELFFGWSLIGVVTYLVWRLIQSQLRGTAQVSSENEPARNRSELRQRDIPDDAPE